VRIVSWQDRDHATRDIDDQPLPHLPLVHKGKVIMTKPHLLATVGWGRRRPEPTADLERFFSFGRHRPALATESPTLGLTHLQPLDDMTATCP
jgi:hypothetical protein